MEPCGTRPQRQAVARPNRTHPSPPHTRTQDFEEPLLQESAGYYKRKAAEWIAADSCPEYMVKARAARCAVLCCARRARLPRCSVLRCAVLRCAALRRAALRCVALCCGVL